MNLSVRLWIGSLLLLGALWPVAPASAAQDASGRLAASIKKWEAFERREFPEDASLRGDHAADNRLTDVSEAAVLRRSRFVKAMLAEIRAIDSATLSQQQRVSRELLVQKLSRRARLAAIYADLPFGPFSSDSWLPLSSLGGPHSMLVILATASRFDRLQDYENYLARMEQVPSRIQDLTKRMTVALDAGWVGPGAPMERVPDQLAPFSGEAIASGPLMAPFSGPMPGVGASERDALVARARQVLTTKVAPAFAGFKHFIEERYLPAARKAPLSASRLPGGREYYDALVSTHTTTSKTPEEIHDIGLREVARIGAEIKAVLASAGFSGSVSEFMAAKRTDPAQRFATSDAMLAGYRDIAKRADAQLPMLFAELPRMPYGIRPMEAFERDNAEHYIPGSADGTRPGYFMANVNRLDRRGRFEMEALLLHETVPGHHLQVARAMENTAIPEFRRHSWETAYGEGWALYAESLGARMGFYREPETRLGYLSSEMMRACRLVVDTGLHRFDWTRQRAIDFIVENAAIDPGFAAAEVDRYASMPGQALAYKMGQLKILELRQRAEAKLGNRFDLRRFHNAVLDDGPLPLDLLDQRIDAWIERERARVQKP
jgi:uncharacterized protein (DUF885 family)